MTIKNRYSELTLSVLIRLLSDRSLIEVSVQRYQVLDFDSSVPVLSESKRTIILSSYFMTIDFTNQLIQVNCFFRKIDFVGIDDQ